MSEGLPARPEQLGPWRAEVARACRMLASEGLVSDILGHVSVRVGSDRMLLRARSEGDPGLLLTRPEDVVLADLDGNPAEDLGDRDLPKELPIHGEVLRSRPDDHAVVHAHPPEVVLCSIADLPFARSSGRSTSRRCGWPSGGCPSSSTTGSSATPIGAGRWLRPWAAARPCS